MIIGVDPGTTESALVTFDGDRVVASVQDDNPQILALLSALRIKHAGQATLAIEMIASYGMPVGATTFETCVWIGRFIQAWGWRHAYVYRRDVKLALCGSVRAKDGNVRQALIDLYGPVGTKRTPGPLYGLSNDLWQAFAVAAVYSGAPHNRRGKSTPIASSESA